MNTNELADEVEMWGRDLLALNMKGGIPVIEGARMLRQQQAEIEALRSLSLRRENLGYFYDLHARQQAEIEALKAQLSKYNKPYPKHGVIK